MTPTATSLDGHALVARYEALRQDVMDSGIGRRTVPGLALFMRKGMAAWMTSIGEEPMRHAAVPAASSATQMPDGIERSLIDIVATMALATALEGRRDC
jgi:hypothetical protein